MNYYGGCIETIVLRDFEILLKSLVIQLVILKIIFKSSVIQYEIWTKLLKVTYNPLLFN